MWEIAGRDYGLRLRISNQVRHLSFSIQYVERHEENARLHAGQIELDQLDAIRKVNRQSVALAKATVFKQTCEPIAAEIEFSKRPGFQRGVWAAPFESGCITPARK